MCFGVWGGLGCFVGGGVWCVRFGVCVFGGVGCLLQDAGFCGPRVRLLGRVCAVVWSGGAVVRSRIRGCLVRGRLLGLGCAVVSFAGRLFGPGCAVVESAGAVVWTGRRGWFIRGGGGLVAAEEEYSMEGGCLLRSASFSYTRYGL